MQIEVRREVAAPAEVVWEIITDLERWPEVLGGIDAVERLDDLPAFQVGTRWRETRTMFGKQATAEMGVTEVEPGRSYTTTASEGSTTYVSTIRVLPVDDANCELTMTFAGTTTGLVSRVLAATLGRLAAGSTRRALAKDLDAIATHAERTAR